MAAVAAAVLRAAEVSDLLVVSRTITAAQAPCRPPRPVAPAPMAELEHELGDADVVVTCTGADSQVLPADVVERAMSPTAREAVVRPRRRTFRATSILGSPNLPASRCSTSTH